MSEAQTQFNELHKKLAKDLKGYQKLYTDSMDTIQRNAIKLPTEEREKCLGRVQQIKDLAGNMDSKGLKEMLEQVKSEIQ